MRIREVHVYSRPVRQHMKLCFDDLSLYLRLNDVSEVVKKGLEGADLRGGNALVTAVTPENLRRPATIPEERQAATRAVEALLEERGNLDELNAVLRDSGVGGLLKELEQYEGLVRALRKAYERCSSPPAKPLVIGHG